MTRRVWITIGAALGYFGLMAALAVQQGAAPY